MAGRGYRIDGELVVLVIGASSGIGRAAAIGFAERGASVVLAARSLDSLTDAEHECLQASKGSSVTMVVPTDVGDAAAVDALFEAAVARFGRVDAVVNTAATIAYGRFEDVPAEVFDKVIATNLTGTANVARASLRRFAEQGGGTLVLTGSLLGKIATPYMSNYVTSKWAVHGLTRVLQTEARELPGVSISLVWPGGVDTPVYYQAGNFTGWEGRPPPPVDSPEKVARAILRAVEHPSREIGVGPANPFIVFGFRFLPGVFDAVVAPLMRVGGLSRTPVEPHPGNVFEPRREGDAIHGKWGRHWLRGLSAAAVGTAGAAAGGLAALSRRLPDPAAGASDLGGARDDTLDETQEDSVDDSAVDPAAADREV